MRKIRVNWRIVLIIFSIFIMIFTITKMSSKGPKLVLDGKADLSCTAFKQNDLVALDGDWKFYWNQLLTPEDFKACHLPQSNSLMKVPGSWNNPGPGIKAYPAYGVATYRLRLILPPNLRDPAIHLQHVADAYKVYANGRLIGAVGKVSSQASDFQDDEKSLILDLPKDSPEVELVIQVAQLNYAGGGLRQSPVVGSKHILEQQSMELLVLQLLFVGGVFVFAIYYFLLFLLQTQNKTALFFSLLCFNSFLRSLIWGEAPLILFFPHVSFDARLFINYLTGINLIPLMILFVLSLFPNENKKIITGLMLLPTLVLEVLLMAPPEYLSRFTNYLYLMILLQMIYLMYVPIKAVLNKRDYAILMMAVICVFVLSITADILYFVGIGRVNLSYMFLFGNFSVIIVMSFIQARQQANTHKKLILYNEKLIEADKLKDKIMATEMSFLQAQIKPHFLNNALNAIANVCEKEGKKAASLILDLAIYLRRSLEFSSLDRMMTVEKELEFVDTYYNIERARFGQKIQLRKEIAISLDAQIPVLILQPLVENAIRHGISKKPEGGTVTVRMKQSDETIEIEIEDDGVGISSDKLETLLDGSGLNQGVGLLNIQNRLLKLYGKGLKISSEPGRTCVKLWIPEVVLS